MENIIIPLSVKHHFKSSKDKTFEMESLIDCELGNELDCCVNCAVDLQILIVQWREGMRTVYTYAYLYTAYAAHVCVGPTTYFKL